MKCFDCGNIAQHIITFTNGINHKFHICNICYENNIEGIGQEYYIERFNEDLK